MYQYIVPALKDHVSLGQMLLSHCKITQTLALNIVKAGRFNNTLKVIFGGNFVKKCKTSEHIWPQREQGLNTKKVIGKRSAVTILLPPKYNFF